MHKTRYVPLRPEAVPEGRQFIAALPKPRPRTACRMRRAAQEVGEAPIRRERRRAVPIGE